MGRDTPDFEQNHEITFRYLVVVHLLRLLLTVLWIIYLDFDASSVLTTTTDIPSTTDSKSIESTQIQSTTITVDGTLTNEAFTTLKNGVQNAIIENVSTTAATYLTDIEEIDNLELNEATDEETDIEEEQYSYSGFANFIGTVQSTLMRNAHKNVKSKISVLKNLRDNLLIDIGKVKLFYWYYNCDSRLFSPLVALPIHNITNITPLSCSLIVYFVLYVSVIKNWFS